MKMRLVDLAGIEPATSSMPFPGAKVDGLGPRESKLHENMVQARSESLLPWSGESLFGSLWRGKDGRVMAQTMTQATPPMLGGRRQKTPPLFQSVIFTFPRLEIPPSLPNVKGHERACSLARTKQTEVGVRKASSGSSIAIQ